MIYYESKPSRNTKVDMIGIDKVNKKITDEWYKKNPQYWIGEVNRMSLRTGETLFIGEIPQVLYFEGV